MTHSYKMLPVHIITYHAESMLDGFRFRTLETKDYSQKCLSWLSGSRALAFWHFSCRSSCTWMFKLQVTTTLALRQRVLLWDDELRVGQLSITKWPWGLRFLPISQLCHRCLTFHPDRTVTRRTFTFSLVLFSGHQVVRSCDQVWIHHRNLS